MRIIPELGRTIMFKMSSCYQCSPSHGVRHHSFHLWGLAYVHVLMNPTVHLNLVGGGVGLNNPRMSPVSVVSVFNIITIRAVLGHVLSRWTVTAWFSGDLWHAHTVTTQPGEIIELSIDFFMQSWNFFLITIVFHLFTSLKQSDSYGLITLFRLTQTLRLTHVCERILFSR